MGKNKDFEEWHKQLKENSPLSFCCLLTQKCWWGWGTKCNHSKASKNELFSYWKWSKLNGKLNQL